MISRWTVLRFVLATAIVTGFTVAKPAAGEEKSVKSTLAFGKDVKPYLEANCISCHGPKQQKGEFRVDALGGKLAGDDVALDSWKAILKRIEIGDMPPKGSPRPQPAQSALVADWIRIELGKAGENVQSGHERAFTRYGNVVDHDALFGPAGKSVPQSAARIWRKSPFEYREMVDGLTGGRILLVNPSRPSLTAKMIPRVNVPFGLTTDAGFRDYSFRYTVSGSEAEQMAMNAQLVIEYMLVKRGKWSPPPALTVIANGAAAPKANEINAAVTYMFQNVLLRDPTPEEMDRYRGFVTTCIAKSGTKEGLVLSLAAVLMHPEAVFRTELGQGKADPHGRVMLAPLELAIGIAYALGDDRPDAALVAAARQGKLSRAEDVRREVTRLLSDDSFAKPRILRFFQEYFGYATAADVFKDPHTLSDAGIPGRYNPQLFVNDTDALVQHVLKNDRDVLRELLITRKIILTEQPKSFYLASQFWRNYNLERPKAVSSTPIELPAGQRMGVLTHPSWLIAHSTNNDNHAIHRGKWVREHLLGGAIPDTPITVEAQLPEEPHLPLRHRMRVTREKYCWTCHQGMDPLGMPFQMFDHYGQFRDKELGQPVDTRGEVIASGDAKLDGPVKNAVEMIERLAGSERVEQVFVRHAFRYWMGRNETLDDASTLQAAHQAYKGSNGSMKALIVSLLTSDSFLYRVPLATAARSNADAK